jgi:hypothetical protein
MYKLIVLIALALLMNSCSNTKWLRGTWEGTGNQIDGKTWKIELTVPKGTPISINYPDLSCGGEWGLTKKQFHKAIFSEKIITGLNKCDQGCEIHAKKSGTHEIELVYYLRSFDPEKPIATAKLKKK